MDQSGSGAKTEKNHFWHLHSWLFLSSFFVCTVWSVFNYVHIPCVFALCFSGILEWPFWTKLVVVAIGFTGGLVFMYVQCKVYIHLWRRLKAYNRVIYVQNRPETCKKLALEKPPLLEPSLENKEALVPTQSDTNSSQYTETEDYGMEVLHVWPLSPMPSLVLREPRHKQVQCDWGRSGPWTQCGPSSGVRSSVVKVPPAESDRSWLSSSNSKFILRDSFFPSAP